MISTDAALRARRSARGRPRYFRKGPPPPRAFPLCAPDPGLWVRLIRGSDRPRMNMRDRD